jgi:hypothetical protein
MNIKNLHFVSLILYICVIHKILTVQNLPWNRIKQFVFLVDMGCVLRGVEIDILFLKKIK